MTHQVDCYRNLSKVAPPALQPHYLSFFELFSHASAQQVDKCSDSALALQGHLSKSSTRIKDAGIAIRHSRGRILFYTAGSRNGFQWMEVVCPHTKKHKTISKRHLFLIEKYFEDVRQDEKHVPDPLESIIPPPGLVKEELRQILFRINQIRPEMKKIRVCTFQMSGKIPDSTNVAFEAPSSPPFRNIWPR